MQNIAGGQSALGTSDCYCGVIGGLLTLVKSAEYTAGTDESGRGSARRADVVDGAGATKGNTAWHVELLRC